MSDPLELKQNSDINTSLAKKLSYYISFLFGPLYMIYEKKIIPWYETNN